MYKITYQDLVKDGTVSFKIFNHTELKVLEMYLIKYKIENNTDRYYNYYDLPAVFAFNKKGACGNQGVHEWNEDFESIINLHSQGKIIDITSIVDPKEYPEYFI